MVFCGILGREKMWYLVVFSWRNFGIPQKKKSGNPGQSRPACSRVGYWSVLTCEESPYGPYAHRQTGEILIYPFFSAFIWIFV